MAEPLIDLTQPVAAKPRRQSAPKSPGAATGKVTRVRRVQPSTPEDPKDARVQARADLYEAWLRGNADAYYIRGASFLAGSDITKVGMPQPDGTVKAISDVITWRQGPKAYMAAHAVAELQELPSVDRLLKWFGPIAPWIMLGGVGVAIGVDAVSMMRLRPVLKAQAQAQAAEPANAQEVPNAPAPENPASKPTAPESMAA